MQTLLVCKTTNLELHGSRVRERIAGGMAARDILANLQVDHEEHYRTLDRLEQSLKRLGLPYVKIGRSDPWPAEGTFDCVITVGGDGTLLSASHNLARGGRMIGVRSSMASVGHLCACGADEVDGLVERLAEGRLEWVAVSRLLACIERVGSDRSIESAPVLNDFLFANEHPAAMTRYRIRWDGLDERHRSSGIWIATAAGSTAGIRAAGGDYVPLSADLFQFKVRELYQPSGDELKIVGGFFDPDAPFVVQNLNERAILALDGQHGKIELEYGDEFRFKRAPKLQLCARI